MTHYRNKYFLMLLFAALAFAGCKKQWDQRDAVVDQQLNVNLFQQIQANSNLSVFAGYLTKIGFDKLLAGSKTYTVWAPTNAALASMDPTIVADTAKLHLFVASHIANQAYLTTGITTPFVRIRVLTGKNVTFTPTTVEDANITSANQYVSNGVLDVIDKSLSYKLNISQYARSLTSVAALQAAFIGRNDSSFVDTTKATVDHIDPVSGKPVLVPNTGVVTLNKYFNKVAKLDSEDSLYTYIVLNDAALTAERNKVSSYFVTSSPDTTVNILSGFNVLKDVAIRGVILPSSLAAGVNTFKSVNGVNVPLDKGAIISSYLASNGIVYVVNACNFNVADKITPIIVQGEQASFYKQSTGTNQLRLRVDNNGVQYRDLLNLSGTVSGNFAAYKLSNLYTCQYKVVIRAINDTAFTKAPGPVAVPTGWTQGGVAPAAVNDTYAPNNYSESIKFGQITGAVNTLGVYTITTLVNYPYKNVPPYFYNEIPMGNAVAGTVVAGQTINMVNGNLNVLKYNSINMYLVGQTSATANLGTIIADYIKLIPILQ